MAKAPTIAPALPLAAEMPCSVDRNLQPRHFLVSRKHDVQAIIEGELRKRSGFLIVKQSIRTYKRMAATFDRPTWCRRAWQARTRRWRDHAACGDPKIHKAHLQG